LLPALDGCVMGVNLPDLSEKLKDDLMLVAVRGVETAGERALRKSVYAVGGVMGVLRLSSSCLMAPPSAERGLLGSSEGRRRSSETGALTRGRSQGLVGAVPLLAVVLVLVVVSVAMIAG
jgi:hypothetical protein